MRARHLQMWRNTATAITLLGFAVCWGCWSSHSSTYSCTPNGIELLAFCEARLITEGMTLSELRLVSGDFVTEPQTPPKHSFTVWYAGSKVTCVSARVHPLVAYYFVFVDDRLTKVVEPPMLERTLVVRADGKRVMVRKPRSHAEHVEWTMNARGIAFEELEGDIIEKIRARQSAQERGRAYQEPTRFWPYLPNLPTEGHT